MSADVRIGISGWTLRSRKRGRHVFVYFDNDVKVHAPFDAIALAERFGHAPGVAVARDKKVAARRRMASRAAG